MRTQHTTEAAARVRGFVLRVPAQHRLRLAALNAPVGRLGQQNPYRSLKQHRSDCYT